MAIEIKSYNQMLGNMIRKIIAESSLNDINTGSVLLTLLEACATNDFENNTAVLSILELLNIDVLKNNDLDTRAADYGLERRPAVRASGFVKISDASITKQSTSLFPIKPAPIAGSTKIYVNDAKDWEPTGTLFIGGGTENFEGPIQYNNIIDNVTFYTIELDSALEKDHLISELIVNSQGTTDRLVHAGTKVQIPANAQSPAIEYVTLRDAIIPAGEDHVDNIEVIAVSAGSFGNAGINTITSFISPVFPDAEITNTMPFTNGMDVETDFELRERIKAYAGTLARGTKSAILSAVIGVSDSFDNKQVASAKITEPVRVGDPSIVYVDDGRGFQPSYSGQSVDILLENASGNEEFLQLANYPLPRPQVVNTADGPYQLNSGMRFRVRVDDQEEEITFHRADFVNIAAATLPEIVTIINRQSELFKARLTDNSTRLLIYPTSHDAEIIQVSSREIGEESRLFANSILKFPTNEFSYIKLYKNSLLLREKESSAALSTTLFSMWGIVTPGNIIISVDGTPAQDRTFTSADFDGAPWNALTLEDWVSAFNKKFAGMYAEALSSGVMRISSNRDGSESSLEILGGSYMNIWFADIETEAVGQTSDFQLNRQNGNVRILTDIDENDNITAGVEDAKGELISRPTITGNYNVSSDANGIPATMVIVADADRVEVRPVVAAVGSTLTISDQGNNVMRILSSSMGTFLSVFATTNDYIFLADRTTDSDWLSSSNTGLFKIISRGDHTTAGVDTYVEVLNTNIIEEGPVAIKAAEDIQAFYSDSYPQIWIGGEMVDNPPAAPIQSIVDSINENIENVTASILKTNNIKITSSTEDGGSIAIPISVSNATLLYPTGNETRFGNPSHIANRTTDVESITYFKRTQPIDNHIWLNRAAYTDVKGILTDSTVPGIKGVDSFADILESKSVLNENNVDHDDIVSFTKGNNENHYKAIKQILSNDKIGTRYSFPRTILDHIGYNDEVQILESLSMSPDDSIVLIFDNDSVNKTIDIPISRTARVNSGSQTETFLPNDTAFSADDMDNEEDIDFGTPQVWSKELNNTEFADYKIWFRARNWYCTQGISSAEGKFLVRAKQYGPVGHNIRFGLEYPSFPNSESTIVHLNFPAYSTYYYYFGSGDARTAGIAANDNIHITDLGSNNFRLQFVGPGIDFSTVEIGDVLSILSDSNISVHNQGQFRINDTNSVDTIDIYNPNGSPTGAPAKEETNVTAIADIEGTVRVDTIDTTNEDGSSLDGEYFILYDQNGSVAFWFDVDNNGTPEPAHGAGRSVLINTVLNTDTSIDVRNRLITAINNDPEFSASAGAGNTLDIAHSAIGIGTSVDAGSTSFDVSSVAGTERVSLDGKYFILHDEDGSVAVWFDVDNNGTPEPLHGADRSIMITGINFGDSESVVAAAVRAEIHADAAFECDPVVNDTFLVRDAVNGNRPSPSSGTSGFTISTETNGSDGIAETIIIPTSVTIFPLEENSIDDIKEKVNAGNVLEISAINDSSMTIGHATREDIVDSISYGHDVDPTSNNHNHVKLYDGETWVLYFNNSNPNFILKKPLVLAEAEPTIYRMDTAPNVSGEEGELFKLLPTTLQNIEHHLTQKALSQLSIVSDIDISTSAKKIQIKSKQLGSLGAIEIVGGRANNAQYNVIGDAENEHFMGRNYIAARIPAFPDSINPGDTILFSNAIGVDRLSRLTQNDTIDVETVGDNCYYLFNDKNIYLTPYVEITISDVSQYHDRPVGTVWRWEHNIAGSLADITDRTIGVPSSQSNSWIADGSATAPALQRIILESGSASAYQRFQLTVNDVPSQGDYYTFESADGSTFAVWYDLGSGIEPTGASYVAATYKIQVIIDAVDNFNTIVAKTINELINDSNFINSFSSFQTPSASFMNVRPGDILTAHGDLAGWSSGNKASGVGDDKISGLPIVEVNHEDRYIDVVNPFGEEMPPTEIGLGNTIKISPTPMIEWKVPHAARTNVVQIIVSGNIATCTTNESHRLKVGDRFNILNNNALPDVPGSVTLPSGNIVDVGTITEVISNNVFRYSTSASDGSYFGGTIIKHDLHNQIIVHNVLKGTSTAASDGSVNTNFTFLSYQDGSADREQITKINMVADVSSSLNNSYFTIYSANDERGYYVWYNVDGAGIDPSIAGYIGIQVDINEDDDENHVAYKTFLALRDVIDFTVQTGYDVTRYKLEKLNFKGLTRISYVHGESPRFLDCGVAVDDLLIISGNTFQSNNNGVFRVRAVDNNSIIFENPNSRKEVNTDTTPFNNANIAVNWQQNSTQITGVAGSFENLSIGDSVKKPEDPESFWVQILSFDTGDPLTATTITLNTQYQGTTSTSLGIKFDQVYDVEAGVKLKSVDDIRILEGDSTRISDRLYVTNIINVNWFNTNNTGNFRIEAVGTYSNYKPFIRVINSVAVEESNRLMSVDVNGLIITENDANNFTSYKKVEHIVQDSFDDSRRIAYLTPADRAYKFSQSNRTRLLSAGKMNFNTDVTSGIDGYIYYTGLLRTVQRIIDGFEPDPETFPGRRAVGGAIEILPPLIRRITLSIDIATDEGVNLGEISNEIRTTIINYINNLGVGRDVILSEIIARVMRIRGVAASTFNIPDPSTERIPISDIEKAFIEARDISLA